MILLAGIAAGVVGACAAAAGFDVVTSTILAAATGLVAASCLTMWR
jgi:hypothetical protein